jgi:hypothetical protein
VKRYERELRKEQERFGDISDGAGKRYLIGPLYLLLDDLDAALEAFAWFEEISPDDVGEPGHLLCWTLALYRAGQLDAATHKLRQTMLSNLYMISYLLGEPVDTSDEWHGLIEDKASYLLEIPSEYFELWATDALQWLQETYQSDVLKQVRERYIEIERQLETEPPGPKRSQLVQEASELGGS